MPKIRTNMSQKDFGYARILLFLIVGFTIIGNYIYTENKDSIMDPFLYHDEPLNDMFYRTYKNLELEGGHDYVFFFFVEGPVGTTLHVQIDFETVDNITIHQSAGAEKTWLRFWGRNSSYTDPLKFESNETIDIDVYLTYNIITSIRWKMRIYQDLPMFLTKPVIMVVIFDVIFLMIWVIAYEQYEKIFDDIKKEKKNALNIKSEENVDV